MIRKIKAEDREAYIAMAKEFYSSEAVLNSIPDSNFELTFEEFMKSDVYAECYIFEHEGRIAGYGLLAKTFSQEAGGLVVWAEEMYVKPDFRGKGLGSEFFEYLENNLSSHAKRVRLEVENDNSRAISMYERIGFKELNYKQMIREL